MDHKTKQENIFSSPPKRNIVSSFTHPHVVQTHTTLYTLQNTSSYIFNETSEVSDPPVQDQNFFCKMQKSNKGIIKWNHLIWAVYTKSCEEILSLCLMNIQFSFLIWA